MMGREQLLCIVAPPARPSLLRLQRIRPGLDALLRRVGRIHFAALVLLPPRRDRGGSGLPSLVLELAVDDGLKPKDVIDLLIQHGFRELWFIYGAHWRGTRGASVEVRRTWLQRALQGWIHPTDGGFVGARDRSVGQILAEARLYADARAQLQRLRQIHGDERGVLARAVADWAATQKRFTWAREPGRRSYWRTPGMTPLRRAFHTLARLGLPLLSLFVVLATLLAACGLIALVPALAVVDLERIVGSPAVFGGAYPHSLQAIVIASWSAVLVILLSIWSLGGVRSPAFAVFLLLAFGAVLVLLIGGTLFMVGLEQFLMLLWVAVVLALYGVGALLWVALIWTGVVLAYGVSLLIVPPYMRIAAVVTVGSALLVALVGALHFALSLVVGWGAAAGSWLFQDFDGRSILGLEAIDFYALLPIVVFTFLAYVIARTIRLPPFQEHRRANRLDRTTPQDLPAAHQIHASIERCEADIVASGRVGHMFSLTDIRRPYWMNRLLLRSFLRLVNYLGHTVFTEGTLGHAQGIRFGHWHIVDGGRRLLFCSNFDGSFGGYLDEFINGASEGINLIWRWTELRERPFAVEGQPGVTRERVFPPTRYLVFGGCKNEQWFKTFARDSMLPHLHRFEAYAYTAQDVERASNLREALFGARTAVNDDLVMRALES